jgi:glycosyltransferase involved in cell wall biosynthesis
MKVLYLNHTGEMSGAEHSLLTLLEGLPDDVSPVVACPEGPLARATAAIGIPVEPVAGTQASLRLHPLRTPGAIGEILSSGWRVRNIARRLGVDLVHGNSIRAGLIAGIARRLGAPPAVAAIHDRLPPTRVSRLTQRTIAANLDMALACSQYVAEPFEALDSGLRVRVVYNPIDLGRFDPRRISRDEARSRLGFSDSAVLLGVIGQITPWKAQDDAVRIVCQLKAGHPEIRLLLVGSPKFERARYGNQAYARRLKELVSSLGVEDEVLWLGERQDIPEMLRALDIVLVPSWEEPFGMVVIESMAMELPVIATEIGGATEVVTPPTDGLLLPPRQPDVWAEAIDRLVERPADRESMGRAARRRVADFLSVPIFVERVLTGYGEVLSR